MGARSGVRKNITYGKQTEKIKLKISIIGPKKGAGNIFGGNQLRFRISAQ